MLTYSMTPVDIFNSILQDREKINYWLNKSESKIIKLFGKQFKYPKYHSENYKHPKSGIDYMLLFIKQNQESKLETKVIAKSILGNKKYFIDFGFGYNIDKGKKCCTAAPVLNIFDGHFFERYKERCLKNESLQIDDVIGKYYSRLTRLNLLEINNGIINDWKEKYGEFSTVFYTNDGICLGRRSICQPPNIKVEQGKANEVAVNEYKTFISADMLSDKQKDSIKEEGLKYYDRYIEHIHDLYEIGGLI